MLYSFHFYCGRDRVSTQCLNDRPGNYSVLHNAFQKRLYSVYLVLSGGINGDGQQRAACSMQYSVVQNEESLPHVIISCVVHSEGQKEKVVIHSMKEFCSVLC